MAEEDECVLGCDDRGNYSYIHRLEDELDLTGRFQVARRHFAMDIFDGVLPVLAILVTGAIFEQFQESLLVFETTVLALLGTAVAHFIAGFGASYLTERAEGTHIIQELERSKKTRLSHAVLVSVEKETALIVALINGFTPSICILLVISPTFLGLFGILGFIDSIVLSIIIGFTLLFFLGIYLGMMADQSRLLYAIKTIFAGFITIVILLLVSVLTGSIHT